MIVLSRRHGGDHRRMGHYRNLSFDIIRILVLLDELFQNNRALVNVLLVFGKFPQHNLLQCPLVDILGSYLLFDVFWQVLMHPVVADNFKVEVRKLRTGCRNVLSHVSHARDSRPREW